MFDSSKKECRDEVVRENTWNNVCEEAFMKMLSLCTYVIPRVLSYKSVGNCIWVYISVNLSVTIRRFIL